MGIGQGLLSFPFKTEYQTQSGLAASTVSALLRQNYDDALMLLQNLTHAGVAVLMSQDHGKILNDLHQFYLEVYSQETLKVTIPNLFIPNQKSDEEMLTELKNSQLTKITNGLIFGGSYQMEVFEKNKLTQLSIAAHNGYETTRIYSKEIKQAYRYFEYRNHIRATYAKAYGEFIDKIRCDVPEGTVHSIRPLESLAVLPKLLLKINLAVQHVSVLMTEINSHKTHSDEVSQCREILNKHLALLNMSHSNHPGKTDLKNLQALFSGYFPKDMENTERLLRDVDLAEISEVQDITKISALISEIIEKGLFHAAYQLLNSANASLKLTLITQLSTESWKRMFENDKMVPVQSLNKLIFKTLLQANDLQVIVALANTVDLLKYFGATLGLESALDLHTQHSAAFEGEHYQTTLLDIKKRVTDCITNAIEKNHSSEVQLKAKMVDEIIEEYSRNSSKFIKLLKSNFPLAFAYFKRMDEDQVKQLVDDSNARDQKLVEILFAAYAHPDSDELIKKFKIFTPPNIFNSHDKLLAILTRSEYRVINNGASYKKCVNHGAHTDLWSLQSLYLTQQKYEFLLPATSQMLEQCIPHWSTQFEKQYASKRFYYKPSDWGVSAEMIIHCQMLEPNATLIRTIMRHLKGFVTLESLLADFNGMDTLTPIKHASRFMQLLSKSLACIDVVTTLFDSISIESAIKNLHRLEIAEVQNVIGTLLKTNQVKDEMMLRIFDKSNSPYFKDYMAIIGEDLLVWMAKSPYAVFARCLYENQTEECIHQYPKFQKIHAKDRVWDERELNLYHKLISLPPAYNAEVSKDVPTAPIIPSMPTQVYPPLSQEETMRLSNSENQIASAPLILENIDELYNELEQNLELPLMHTPSVITNEESTSTNSLHELRQELNEQKQLTQSLIHELNEQKKLTQSLIEAIKNIPQLSNEKPKEETPPNNQGTSSNTTRVLYAQSRQNKRGLKIRMPMLASEVQASSSLKPD